MSRRRGRAIAGVVLALLASDCSRTTTIHTAPEGPAARGCQSLASKGPGISAIEFSAKPSALVTSAYGRYPGVDDFVHAAGSGTIVTCSLDNPAPALHGCRHKQTTFLMSSDGLKLPCGAQPAP